MRLDVTSWPLPSHPQRAPSCTCPCNVPTPNPRIGIPPAMQCGNAMCHGCHVKGQSGQNQLRNYNRGQQGFARPSHPPTAIAWSLKGNAPTMC
mmetsp:Transcript_68160/g.114168  ORF Transcript_68160/g.114168 Transcript_68160/m.114168 type:complete len:93 (+) Transcript_68160:94-372(+)